MTLTAGTRIGKYELQSLIGEGGMGRVYRALDTELGRPVALKFLPAEVAADPRRMSRFEQEARAVSALNHPNILTVYEFGRAGSSRFFATEFVDGSTLREYAAARRLGPADVLDIGVQVAGALAAAHAGGIVHRDIKPENVMVRPDGYVKVLDFGLAKPAERAPAEVDTEAATRPLVNTDPGVVMGTARYMSPEQARGLETDARTDIWSLGVLLYELLAGRPPFTGETMTDTLLAVVSREPAPLRALAPDAPEALEWVVTKALTKEKEERYQTARELLTDLRRLRQRLDAGAELERSPAPPLSDAPPQAARTAEAAGTSTVPSADRDTARAERRWLLPALATAFALASVAGLGLGLYQLFIRRPASARARFAPLEQMKFTRIPVSGGALAAVISPDGRFVARAFSEKGKLSLRLRQTSGTTERDVVAPAEVSYNGLAFSHDGTHLYYCAGERGKSVRGVYRVSVLGGDPQKLLEGPLSGVTLAPDDRRLAFRRRVEETGEDAVAVANEDGTGERVVATRKPPARFGNPAWSPDGRLIAYTVHDKDEEGEYATLEATDPSDGSTKVLSAARWRVLYTPVWLPGGEGVVVVGRPRVAAKGEKAQVWFVPSAAGEAQKVTNDANDYGALSLTADGRTALVTQTNVSSNVWVVPPGDFARARQVTDGNSTVNELCWTADGRIIYSTPAGAARSDLWIMNADGTGARQLTFTPDRSEMQPALTPDGRQVVFMGSEETGLRSLGRMSVEGGAAQELARNVGLFPEPQVSPDSRWVFYNTRDENDDPSFWKVPLEGGRPLRLMAKSPCRLSPDGKWFLCGRNEPAPGANSEMFVVPAEGGEPVRTLAWPKGTNSVYWSPDGRGFDFIVERDGVANVYRLPLAGGREQRLTDWQTAAPLWNFAWSRDGRTLAVTRDTMEEDLVLIQNFR